MESLIIESNPLVVKNNYTHNPLLDLFKHDPARDLMYSDIVGYQLDLSGVTEVAKRLFPDMDHNLFASWTKLSKNPTKAKGWYTVMLQAMFNGQHDLNHLNKDLQLEETGNGTKKPSVSMMFLPHGTSNPNMETLVKITQDALSNWAIIPVYGGSKFRSGKKVTNKNAEKFVKEEIERARSKGANINILILASQMAQRSFSEGLIDEVYLAYDNGSEGATIQKMARALTGDDTYTKKAKIFSLSFDPNRDDKIQCLILQSAINMMEKEGQNNPSPFIKRVLNSLDIFSCQTDGNQIKWEATTYVKDVLTKSTIARVLGQQIDTNKLTYAQMILLSKGNTKASKSEKLAASIKGKTHETTQSQNYNSEKSQKRENLEGKAKEKLIGLLENSWYIMDFGFAHGCSNITESLLKIKQLNFEIIIEAAFDIPFNLVEMIFMEDIIQRHHANLINQK